MKTYNSKQLAVDNSTDTEHVIRLHSGGWAIVPAEFKLDRQYFHDKDGRKNFFSLEDKDMSFSTAMGYVLKNEVTGDERKLWISNKNAANEISEHFKDLWNVGKGQVTGPFYLSGYGDFYEIIVTPEVIMNETVSS